VLDSLAKAISRVYDKQGPHHQSGKFTKGKQTYIQAMCWGTCIFPMFSLLLGYFSNMLSMVGEGNRYGLTRGRMTRRGKYGLPRVSATVLTTSIAMLSNMRYKNKYE
jgi:hypothetical protein